MSLPGSDGRSVDRMASGDRAAGHEWDVPRGASELDRHEWELTERSASQTWEALVSEMSLTVTIVGSEVESQVRRPLMCSETRYRRASREWRLLASW